MLGATGVEVSEIGVGGWAIGGPDWNLGVEMGWADVDDREAERALVFAAHFGASHFDTADIYGHGRSERTIGRALRRRARNSYVLASKVGYFRGTSEHAMCPLNIRNQLEVSLQNLGTDYLDIFYLHNLEFGPDDRYLEGAVREMERLRQSGKIRFIGMRGPHRFRAAPSSTSPLNKVARFFQVADVVRPDVVQLRYNILTAAAGQELDEVFAWAERAGVGIVMNKPLAQGLLLGKYGAGEQIQFGAGDHRNRKQWFRPVAVAAINRRLEALRDRFGCSRSDLARVAIQYCLAKTPIGCVVVGFRDQAQLEVTLGAVGQPLSREDVAFVERVVSGLPAELGSYFPDSGTVA